MSEPRPVSVRGGAAGIEAHSRDLTEVAHLFGSAARYSCDQSVELHGYLVDPTLARSALLDPWGAGEFEADLMNTLDGRGGLSWLAARCAALAMELRAAAALYLTADRLSARFVPAWRGLGELVLAAPGFTGIRPRVAGVAVTGPPGTGGPPGTAASGSSAAGANGTTTAGANGTTTAGANGFAAANPEVVDLAVDLVTAFWSDYQLIHRVATWPDGRPLVTARGTDDSPAARRPPRSLQDVVAGLARRNRGRTGGDVDVRLVSATGADGRSQRRIIVDIPGTKNWSASPRASDPTSLGTNLRAITGATTTYGRGVIQALRRAGVTRTEPVLLVGHSQGGLVALDVARELEHSREFSVTHVVAAGSPVAQLTVPPSVQLLAIENDGDVIPHADGADNPDHVNETTVKAHRDTGDAATNHDLDRSYVPAAGDVDASTDPSARAYVDSLQPFLTGSTVRTEVFHIERR